VDRSLAPVEEVEEETSKEQEEDHRDDHHHDDNRYQEIEISKSTKPQEKLI